MSSLPSARLVLASCLLSFVSWGSAQSAETAGLCPARLRCEYHVNPEGIDVARPRLGWELSSRDASRRGQKQTAYQILVGDDRNALMRGVGNLWDSGKVASDRSLHIPYGGKPLSAGQRCFWRVRVWDEHDRGSAYSAIVTWSMGPMSPADWKAQWIVAPSAGGKDRSFPWVRKTFDLPNKPVRGTAHVCVMGYYELYVNGKRVGDGAPAPAVSHYPKRALYLTHDITPLLKSGKNCVALWLGRGWYVPGVPGATEENPPALAQFTLESSDGSKRVVGTDAGWKSHPSPLAMLGEGWSRLGPQGYDARKEVPGWSEATLDDSAWTPVRVITPPKATVAAQACEPNRVVEMLPAVQVEELSPGTYLIDMGRLFTGGFEMVVKAPRDTKIRFEYAEHRGPKDQLQTYNQAEEYTARGDGAELFSTRLCYHAFRWVLVKGLPSKPELSAARGRMMTTDLQRTAAFRCSDELLNRIYETTLWTYRCLSIGGYVVDCSHRERLGYGGDAHATTETAMTNFDVGAFYTKWAADWRDAQEPNGDLPHVAPPIHFAGGGPAWSGICIAMPWQAYRYYGDRDLLEAMYPTMQRWLAFLETQTRDGLLRRYGRKDWAFLGDWVAPGKGQEEGQRVDDRTTLFFNNCYYVYNLRDAARAAEALGKTEDAAAYRRKADALAAAVHKEFYDAAKHTYANGEQPYPAFALLAGVTPEPLRAQVLDRLAETIVKTDKGHINAGIHGHYLLLKTLLENDRNDLSYTMVRQETYPGWGHMLVQGATTIWEQWDGLNSHCHSSFLGVGSWFVQGIAGIRPDDAGPGFQRIVIKPSVLGNLQGAEAVVYSPRGTIHSVWQREGEQRTLRVEIPPNTSGVVYVPAVKDAVVTEGDVPAEKAVGVRFLRRESGAAVYEIGSGRYVFRSAPPQPAKP